LNIVEPKLPSQEATISHKQVHLFWPKHIVAAGAHSAHLTSTLKHGNLS
jgi:hypothetical protein